MISPAGHKSKIVCGPLIRQGVAVSKGSKIRWLYHEKANAMAVADLDTPGLPLIHICDDDFQMISPFYSYPYDWLLKYSGWTEIGDFNTASPASPGRTSSGAKMNEEKEWLDDEEVQELLKWLEKCTLAELMLAKEFVEKHRGHNQ